ncbi:MAG: type III-B CRISPR-associated protein Cas10/Cmr2 [Desulfitobacteriaceae bacterium]|nr:type III-B CRISPR-associated protein Cas10/Cmr2 [Desulfitobacteriaceae bacterium]MDI6915132.1 type III-B CRISPR-associated protein Cas10/Cmr2 [Desulfitobacteriaceae bacterium]
MSSDAETFMHFTLGPVQGFVAQARRTRDLWAGSFLLSYLSGIAMTEILKKDGAIVFPAVEKDKLITDPLLRKIAEVSNEQRLQNMTKLEAEARSMDVPDPTVGTLPNRFKARIPQNFDPRVCVQAVQEHWQKIADVVWQKFMEPCAAELPEINTTVHQIWQRQVTNFWDMAWVVGTDDDLLDRRKNWRTHVPPAEQGSKCTVMGTLQELSGYERAQRKEREKQDEFWVTLRAHVPDLDLDENERLCAIAFIKRFFPRVAKEGIGWSVPKHFPSTSALAALPWIARRLEADPEGCINYAKMLSFAGHPEEKIAESKKVAAALVDALRKMSAKMSVPAADKVAWDVNLKNFAMLQGSCFFTDDLKNERLWNPQTKAVRDQARKRLSEWSVKPSPFYAMLLMDGDRLGAILQEKEDIGTSVSEALADFTGRVEDIVLQHSGFLIYAGGDDVLAMFPVEGALQSAIDLRTAYQEAFQRFPGIGLVATISAAIIFAQHTLPLRDVLSTAHHVLDQVAKEECGRDSLAVHILRSSGPGFRWLAPWSHVLNQSNDTDYAGDSRKPNSSDALGNRLEALAQMFRLEAGEDLNLNAGFLYNLRERYELFGLESESEHEYEDFWIHLFAAEFVKNRQREVSREKTQELMRALFETCREVRRVVDKTEEGERVVKIQRSKSWTIDGALLTRFLAQKGVED